MTTYVYRNGEMVEKDKTEPLSGFQYISDNMDPLFHHAALRYIDSKSEFRRQTRAHGCVEIGDAPIMKPRTPQKLDNRQRVQDIKKAIYQLRNGHR